MKYLDEFRDPQIAKAILGKIREKASKPWTIMEICGGQTHSIIRNGIDQLLGDKISLIHGPGCPVCVTPLEKIDKAIRIASMPDVIFTSFGDMLRVPGSNGDLLGAKSEGADVRIIYSPLEALSVAESNPDKIVVFFAVGFETTAPGNAMLLYQAAKRGFSNLNVLVSHVLVPPAIESILSSPGQRVNGFIAAGHVCTITGWKDYEEIAKKHKVPIVPTGFEPVDILEGIYMVISQLEEGRQEVENQYLRSVSREGNEEAQHIVREVFEVCDRQWRGIGGIPQSGLKIREKYQQFDAEYRFDLGDITVSEPEVCISGLVLQGMKKPYECPAFGKECQPKHPLGATMVSSEGACSAYYLYQKSPGA